MIDLTPYFKQYEALVYMAQRVFERVSKEYPDCVQCKIGCDDCCYALFDLTLIEALYINHHFNRKFSGAEKGRLLDVANRADRDVYKIKKKAYQQLNKGKSEDQILVELAGERVKCPLLNEEKTCALYAYRPITCRLYGIPTALGGTGFTCGISKFSEGEKYPTVNMDPIVKQLYEISGKLIIDLKSKHIKMSEMLVPLSMALLTEYNETYLGIADGHEVQDSAGENEDGEK